MYIGGREELVERVESGSRKVRNNTFSPRQNLLKFVFSILLRYSYRKMNENNFLSELSKELFYLYQHI